MTARSLLFFLMVIHFALSSTVRASGDPNAGQQKFKECAKCHGSAADTASQEPIPKLGGQHAEYVLSALEGYISGERTHAGMKGISAALTRQDKEDIAAYLGQYELTKFPIPSLGEPTPLERKLEVCRSCHGERGKNFAPNTPQLIGQDERYLLESLKGYQNGKRKNPSMVYVVRNLTERDLAEMASYYASQKEGLTPID
jgi:cytochrome c553